MKKLIAGNWKMNGSIDEARTLIADIINGIHMRQELLKTCDFLVCPPFVHLSAIRHALYNSRALTFGAQDCAEFRDGAYTGGISAAMLRDAGCTHVILGHSERRTHFGETDEQIGLKVAAAYENELTAIICVGEKEAEREAGREQEIVEAQVKAALPDGANAENTVIAYEPVWAIGTGKTPTPEDVGKMHGFIRELLSERAENHENVRILYGGSMKPDNAKALLEVKNVDGGLIGGASLSAETFLGIAQNA